MYRIPVFFTQRMVAEQQGGSPSAAKPGLVLRSWQAMRAPIELLDPAAATRAELCLAHDPEYVDGILSSRVENGFGTHCFQISKSVLFTVGAMIGAARYAALNGGVAVAPCSGFNRAGYAGGRCNCTFNGVVIAAEVVRRAGLASRVGILDFDLERADGTCDVLMHAGLGDRIAHYSAGFEYARRDQAGEFLRRVPDLVRSMADCDLLIYQAGVNVHVDDAAGGWLTTEEIVERDRLVFQTALALGKPIAWNLAGGCQRDPHGTIRPVLDLHDATMRTCIETHLPGAPLPAPPRQALHAAAR
ncbi:MAG: hypothetical protein HY749_14715 [Gammaproteobacteria bacterium]|nr:hypothetical protein [Gammaproteobacteria bacterium]MBI5617220.1 hypothetical protein [Gammaproteobacteria bacterium]